jgi:hypothetical protein
MILPIPDDAYLLDGRDDKGKEVKITSVGGCFNQDTGTILHGPFVYPYDKFVKIGKPKKGEKQKVKKVPSISAPGYYVLVHRIDRALYFMPSELEM